MPQLSSIDTLAPEIKQEVDRAIKDRNVTIDEIVVLIQEMGADRSRSAVGRYKKNMEEEMRHYKDAMELAKRWAKEMDEDPGSDVGTLVSEMIKGCAVRTIASLSEGDGVAKPKELMELARAVQSLSSRDKTHFDRYLKVKQELERVQDQQKEATKQVEKIIKKEGMSAQTRADIMSVLTGGHK